MLDILPDLCRIQAVCWNVKTFCSIAHYEILTWYIIF